MHYMDIYRSSASFLYLWRKHGIVLEYEEVSKDVLSNGWSNIGTYPSIGGEKFC